MKEEQPLQRRPAVSYDVLTMGRVGVDIYPLQTGVGLEDALEASYVAEACELSRHRHQPVPVAEVRQ